MKTLITTAMTINDVEVTIDGFVHFTTDYNYGADADGNRGSSRTVVEDVTEISAYDKDMKQIVLTPEDRERASNILTRIFLEG